MTVRYYQQLRPWQQLFYLISVSVGCAIIGTVLSLGIIAVLYGRGMIWQILQMTNTGNPDFINAFRIFLGLGNTLFVFFVPAVIFAYYIVREPDGYIKARNNFPPVLLLLALGFMIFFLPTIDITGYFNHQLTLPPSMHGLDKWIRDSEAQAAAAVKVALDMKTVGDLLISLLVVAVLPALSEEFFFRGCLQPIIERWTKNTHWAIWITAFIFSFMHFEFLGFLPRFLMGAGLGYLFAWSGSIWPSVAAHCLNNGLAVWGYYAWQHHLVKVNPDSTAPMFNQAWIYILSTATALFIMVLYQRVALAYQPVEQEEDFADGEELG